MAQGQFGEQETRQMALRLPQDIYERLAARARRQTIPVAVLARMLLVECLERREQEESER